MKWAFMQEPRITAFTLTLEMLPPTSHLIMCRATEVKTKLKTASMLKTQLAIQMKVFGSTATPALQQVKKLVFSTNNACDPSFQKLLEAD